MKITKRSVDAAKADSSREQWLYDDDLKGFALRISKTGTRTYCVQYRAGKGRGAPKRTVTIGKHGTVAPEQARQEAKRILADVTRGMDPAASRAADKKAESVAELIEAFLADVAMTKKPRTVGQYKAVLRRIIRPALGTRKASAVTASEVSKVHRGLADTPFQANRTIAVLSAMYGWAGKQHIVTPGFNPAQHIERYREEGRQRFLSDEELGSGLIAS